MQNKTRPFKCCTFNSETTFQPCDTVIDHVHAHTTPRHLGHHRFGTKTWAQNQATQLIFGQIRSRCDQAILHCFVINGGQIQTASVIRANHFDLLAAAPKTQRNCAQLRFAHQSTFFGQLQTVVHRIAQQVQQGLGQAREHVCVQCGGLSMNYELHPLTCARSSLSNIALEAGHHGFHWHQARLQQLAVLFTQGRIFVAQDA